MDFFFNVLWGFFFKVQDCRKQQLLKTVQNQDFCPVNHISTFHFKISTFNFRPREKKYIK